MSLLKPVRTAALAAGIALGATAAAQAASNVLFILDASNSMWGQAQGTSKIETAKQVLSDALSDLAADTTVGLMAYGHRVEGDWGDVETLSAFGSESTAEIIRKVQAIKPKGKTPIAQSIKASAANFAGLEEQNNHVVLISDGLESCDGDPCGEAAALIERGINVRVHVVGFDVDADTRAQLECIAEKGQGKYFDAKNAAGFQEAIAEVQQVAQAAPEPEPEPTITEYFRDDFDGDVLGEAWDVLNPNPDAYIVENGVLTVLTSEDKSLRGGELENIFRLTKPMPKGDWTATMRFTPEVATFREFYIMALYKDKDNMLAATTGNYVKCCDNAIVAGLWGKKVSKGKPTSFKARVLVSHAIGNFKAAIHNYTNWTAANEKAILMRIEKSGRNYIISAKIEGEITMKDGQEPQWVKIQKLTSLRPPGDSLVMALTQRPFSKSSYEVNGGEALVAIDWIKIEAPDN